MRTFVLLLLLLVPALASCGSSNDAADGTTVVAAFYPLAWAAEQIGGKGVDVVNLTPPGSEPHDIELSPRDIEAIDGAHLVLYLGYGFMPALEDAVKGHDNAVDLLAGERLRTSVGEPGSGVDPHVWLDPLRYAAHRREGRRRSRKAGTRARVGFEARTPRRGVPQWARRTARDARS